MNKGLKGLILGMILVVPVLIFIFLKVFGVNQFDLPVYYEDGVDTAFTDCEFQKGLHRIPDFSFPDYEGMVTRSNDLAGKSLIVYFTQNPGDSVGHRVNSGLARVLGSFEAQENISVLTIHAKDSRQPVAPLRELAKKYNNGNKAWIIGYANPVYTNQLARCGFIIDFDAASVNTNNILALADHEGKIRGYFNGLDDDDIDRLIVELKILNSNQK